jgi:hypothetical protein
VFLSILGFAAVVAAIAILMHKQMQKKAKQANSKVQSVN